jgi:syntaxin-binding protein 1
LLIVDRSFDLVSPVIHDYYYQNIVYDVREVGDNGKTKADNRVVYLNDQDELWVRFRNKHLAYVMNKVNAEAQAVIKDSKKGKLNTDDMNLQEMAELLRDMPKVEELMKNYQIHIDLAFKIVTDFQKNSKRDLINLEQKIITGLDGKGNKVNNTKLVMEVSQLAKDLTDIDYLRMLIIYISIFELSSKDKSTMLKSLNEEKHRTIV